MTDENPNDIEVRKLPLISLYQLSQMLEGDGWKDLLGVIPGKEENSFKYNVEHIKLIETKDAVQHGMCAQIFLEEWGISGRHRPTLSVLVQYLLKANQYRAACYVAEELLKGPRPPRPKDGPGKEVVYPSEVVEDESYKSLRIKYLDLETYTSGFADSEVIGRGAFGIVYQANLPDIGAVAVKRILTNSPFVAGVDLIRQFKTEVALLSSLTHLNLLPLLGYSDDGPALCLAYKYMRHGSLLAKLAKKDAKSVLYWRTRIEIGVGTAQGISYLHTGLAKPLIHRDIKTANILLDDNFIPKLGDFGLARIGSATTHKTRIAIGTSAYMAPETTRGDVSVKMDIFSFGVVLLELVTGLPPYDNTREGHDLMTHIMLDSVDKILLVDRAAGYWPPPVVTALFGLAELCLSEKKTSRPSASTIIETLNSCLV